MIGLSTFKPFFLWLVLMFAIWGVCDFAIQSMTGSNGRQRVPAESLSHFRVVSPWKGVAGLCGWFIEPMFAHASGATEDSRTLAALRDTLLPSSSRAICG